MLCTECGEAVITKVFTDIQPNQNRAWFWAQQCRHCGHLADAGFKPDSHSCTSSREHPPWKSHFEN
jgi:hypothetical protein